MRLNKMVNEADEEKRKNLVSCLSPPIHPHIINGKTLSVEHHIPASRRPHFKIPSRGQFKAHCRCRNGSKQLRNAKACGYEEGKLYVRFLSPITTQECLQPPGLVTDDT